LAAFIGHVTHKMFYACANGSRSATATVDAGAHTRFNFEANKIRFIDLPAQRIAKRASVADLGQTDRVSAPTRAVVRPRLLPFIALCVTQA